MARRTWHSDRPQGDPARTIDRRKHRQPDYAGPAVACCGRHLVSADMLVRVPEHILARVQAAMPHLEGPGPHYLCDGCRALLTVRRVAAPEDFHEPRVSGPAS